MNNLQQKIDTSDIDQKIHEKRKEAIQQLFREIENKVEMLVDSGKVSSRNLNDGSIIIYVSFNVGHMPSFRWVFPFGKGVNICDSESPIFKEQSKEAVKQLQRLATDRKIEINTIGMREMVAAYYIPKKGEK